MAQQRELIWDIEALASFEASLQWISSISLQQAEKIEQAILEKIEIIITDPTRYPPDKYKKDNSDNTYRFFEAYHHRISYRHTEKEITILRVRHVKQEPLDH